MERASTESSSGNKSWTIRTGDSGLGVLLAFEDICIRSQDENSCSDGQLLLRIKNGLGLVVQELSLCGCLGDRPYIYTSEGVASNGKVWHFPSASIIEVELQRYGSMSILPTFALRYSSDVLCRYPSDPDCLICSPADSPSFYWNQSYMFPNPISVSSDKVLVRFNWKDDNQCPELARFRKVQEPHVGSMKVYLHMVWIILILLPSLFALCGACHCAYRGYKNCRRLDDDYLRADYQRLDYIGVQ